MNLSRNFLLFVILLSSCMFLSEALIDSANPYCATFSCDAAYAATKSFTDTYRRKKCFSEPLWTSRLRSLNAGMVDRASFSPTFMIGNWLSVSLSSHVAMILLTEVGGYNVSSVAGPMIDSHSSFRYIFLCCKPNYVSLEFWGADGEGYGISPGDFVYYPLGYAGWSGLYVPKYSVQQYPLMTTYKSFMYLPEYLNALPPAFSTPCEEILLNRSMPCSDSNYVCSKSVAEWRGLGPPCVNGRYVPPQCVGENAKYCREILLADPTWETGVIESMINNTHLNFTLAYLGVPDFETSLRRRFDAKENIMFYWFQPDPLIVKFDSERVAFIENTEACARKASPYPYLSQNDCDFKPQLLMKEMRSDTLAKDKSFRYFFQSLHLSMDDMTAMMKVHTQGGGTMDDFDAACSWLKSEESYKIWQEWIHNDIVNTTGSITTSSGYDQQYVVIITVVSVGAAILATALPAIWYLTKSQRHLRKVLDNNKVATELAEAVAVLDFEGVAYLREIKTPNRIQTAFLKIVDQLTSLRAFIPLAVLVKTTKQQVDDDTLDSTHSSLLSFSLNPLTPTTSAATEAAAKKQFDEQKTSSLPSSTGSFSARPIVKLQIAVMYMRFQFVDPMAPDFEPTYAMVMDTIIALNDKHRGLPTVTFGNDFVITFNAASKCLAKTFHSLSYAIALEKRLAEAYPAAPPKVALGTAAGIAYCGDMGCARMKSFGVMGSVLKEASTLVHYSADSLPPRGGQVGAPLPHYSYYGVAVGGSHYHDAMSDFSLEALDVNPHRERELVFVIHKNDTNANSGSAGDNEWMYQMESDKTRLEFNEAAMQLLYCSNETLMYDFLKQYDTETDSLETSTSNAVEGVVSKQVTSYYCQKLREFMKKR